MMDPHPSDRSITVAGPAVVLIALRSLVEGKRRLERVLDRDQRGALIHRMADRVMSATHELPVLVVHEEPEVAQWAHGHAAEAFQPSAPGLNRAVTEGRDLLAARGVERVIVTHADLPRAQDLRVMLSDDALVTIAPDLHRDGTNVMCVSTRIPFEFAYGPGSFDSHVSIAQKLGIEPHIVEAPDLAFDIDHPDDLIDFPLTAAEQDRP